MGDESEDEYYDHCEDKDECEHENEDGDDEKDEDDEHDWFSPNNDVESVPATAHNHTPLDYQHHRRSSPATVNTEHRW